MFSTSISRNPRIDVDKNYTSDTDLVQKNKRQLDTQTTRDIEPNLGLRWASVVDDDQALRQNWLNVVFVGPG